MKKIILVIIVSILSLAYNYAQISPNAVRAAKLRGKIYDKVKAVIGDSSHVITVMDIDRAKTDRFYKSDFSDPYGMLEGCTLFTCGPKPPERGYYFDGNYWLGIFKENRVVWLSESFYSENLHSSFDKTLDINNDGTVEIIHHWYTSELTGPTKDNFLHIISWDGQNGVFLNQGGIDTKIAKYRGSFKVIDLNGDNVSEIVAEYSEANDNSYDGDTLKTVYCWNGSYYGEWADCPAWPDPNVNPYYPFTAANDFDIDLNTEVKINGDDFEYSVRVQNLDESKQNIEQFFFRIYSDSLSWLKPADWGGTVALNGDLIGISTVKDTQTIIPGGDENFVYRSNGLPKIAECYFLAGYQVLDTEFFLGSVFYLRDKNILTNSVKGTILSSSPPPDPFISSEFLDTLINYNTNSYELGWITDEQTKTKYENNFTAAKDALLNGDTSSARTYLQNVLTDVDVDSSSTLTSEAYALLRYNTEYLLKQLER